MPRDISLGNAPDRIRLTGVIVVSVKRAVIDTKKCDKSPGCPARRICPADAIEREESNEPYFVNAYCQGCGKCINFCPRRAISMV
ncbi:MAG: 4Fe-4S ferredoxin [Firmicutes bacterium HGW-Firmicutes-14]|nr:MAG: 4Fe-4S ferredoxin [Firmicutes bacterium HGW-Firmicutes-14]